MSMIPSESLSVATAIDTNSEFARHICEGLSAEQAYLSSRFIYDERGSRLFQRIMALDSYYLTRAEFEIFGTHDTQIARAFAGGGKDLELIELGAGDGTKTKLLLEALQTLGAEFTYRPVDINADILDVLRDDLHDALPGLSVEPLVGSYLDALGTLESRVDVKRVVLLLGSNIGNFDFAGAKEFVAQLGARLAPGDQLFIGVDLRKDPRQILAAYDDDTGVTAAFNLNLLHRLRNEFDAELELKHWGFYPTYNPETGEVRSYLYPLGGPQRIRIPALGVDRTFETHEVIHTEVSRKYSSTELRVLAKAAKAEVRQEWTDGKGLFVDVLMEVEV